MVLLSAFVTLCEGYLGVLPTLELWGEFFQSKLGTRVKGVPLILVPSSRRGDRLPTTPSPSSR